MERPFRCVIVALVLMGLPTLAHAQNGGIAGVVRDTSGAVMPGVTVEVRSPALIEQVRTTSSDMLRAIRVIGKKSLNGS